MLKPPNGKVVDMGGIRSLGLLASMGRSPEPIRYAMSEHEPTYVVLLASGCLATCAASLKQPLVVQGAES